MTIPRAGLNFRLEVGDAGQRIIGLLAQIEFLSSLSGLAGLAHTLRSSNSSWFTLHGELRKDYIDQPVLAVVPPVAFIPL